MKYKNVRTIEDCISDAKKYKGHTDWKKNSGTIYKYAYTKNWLKQCLEHFGKSNVRSRTKEECIADAKKYKSRRDWQKNSGTIHQYAYLKNWLQECIEHFGKKPNVKNRTKEDCIADAKKYKGHRDWKKNSVAIYKYAYRKNWLKECLEHFGKSNVKNRTIEDCIEDAKKYYSFQDWKLNNHKVLRYALKKKWYKECSKYFKIKKQII